jgi:hypothetical protein
MDFLVVGGFVVPVPNDGASVELVAAGEFARALDGSPTSDADPPFEETTVRTLDMPRASADALSGVLRGAMPVACSGRLLGRAVACDARPVRMTPAGLDRYVVEFVLRPVSAL